MAEILVITCPSGKQCSHLIPLLYGKGTFKLRLAAHSEKSATNLRSKYPDAEVVSTDLTELKACQRMVRGATSVYHVGPSFHSREKEIGFNMIDAAVVESERPGNVFKHFVFSGVLATQHRNLMQHDLKSYVEERLYLSPLNWTILKPTNFMSAYPVAMLAQAENPAMERLWNAEVPNSLIALEDLAEAAAKVLNEREAHYLAEYPMCSTMPCSDMDVAKAIEKRIGKKITVTSPSFEVGVQRTLNYLFGTKAAKDLNEVFTDNKRESIASGLSNDSDLRSDIARDSAERLVLFYNRRGLVGSPNVLRWLLGREPTTVEQWIDIEMTKAGLA